MSKYHQNKNVVQLNLEMMDPANDEDFNGQIPAEIEKSSNESIKNYQFNSN